MGKECPHRKDWPRKGPAGRSASLKGAGVVWTALLDWAIGPRLDFQVLGLHRLGNGCLVTGGFANISALRTTFPFPATLSLVFAPTWNPVETAPAWLRGPSRELPLS
jgi:hypothetical protein